MIRLSEEYGMIELAHSLDALVSLNETSALRTTNRRNRLEAMVAIDHILRGSSQLRWKYLLHAERLAKKARLAVAAHETLGMETLVSHLHFGSINLHMTVTA